MRLRNLLILAAAGAATAACKSTTDAGPQPAHVLVTPDTVTIAQLSSTSLAVQVTDKNDELLTGVAVTFTSSNSQMVTVSNLGVITSVGPAGKTSVVVHAGKAATVVPVTVIPVSSGIKVTPDPVTLQQMGNVQLQAQVVDAVGTPVPGEVITYTPANPQMITVSTTGLVHSVGPAGGTSIALTSGSLSRTLSVTVTQVATDLKIAPSTLYLIPNGSGRFTATLVDAVGAPMPTPTVTWSSSNTSVATIASSGLATSVGPLGSSTITATAGGFTRTAQLNVVNSGHPLGSNVTTVAFPGAWGVAVSSGNVMLAPSSAGMPTARADLPGTTLLSINGVGGISVAFNRSGSTAYVVNQNNNQLYAIDVATNGVTPLATLNVQPLSVVVGPDDATLYIGSGGQVVPFDIASKTARASIPVPGDVNSISINPVQPMIYATGFDAGKVTEINTTTNTAGRAFTIGSTPQESVVSPDGGTLYIAGEGNDLFVFDLASGNQTARVAGGGGFGAAMTPDGQQIWVATGTSNTVKVIDRASLTIVETVTVQGTGRRIAFSKDGTIAVITDESSGISFVQ